VHSLLYQLFLKERKAVLLLVIYYQATLNDCISFYKLPFSFSRVMFSSLVSEVSEASLPAPKFATKHIKQFVSHNGLLDLNSFGLL